MTLKAAPCVHDNIAWLRRSRRLRQSTSPQELWLLILRSTFFVAHQSSIAVVHSDSSETSTTCATSIRLYRLVVELSFPHFPHHVRAMHVSWKPSWKLFLTNGHRQLVAGVHAFLLSLGIGCQLVSVLSVHLGQLVFPAADKRSFVTTSASTDSF